jgi:transcription elongation factor Elf1
MPQYLHWTQLAGVLNCPRCEYLRDQLSALKKTSVEVDGAVLVELDCPLCGFSETVDVLISGPKQKPMVIPATTQETAAIKEETVAAKREGQVSSAGGHVTLDEVAKACSAGFPEEVKVEEFLLSRRIKSQPGPNRWVDGKVVGRDPDSVRISYWLKTSNGRESEICSVTLFPDDGPPNIEEALIQIMREATGTIKGPADVVRVVVPNPVSAARVFCPKCGQAAEMCGCPEMQPFLKNSRPGNGGSGGAEGAGQDGKFNAYLQKNRSALRA